MVKKILLTLLFLFITIIASFFIWRYLGYASDKDPYKTFLLPRLELSQVNITSFTSEKTEMMLKLTIKNHVPLSFTADSLQYGIYINDREVVKDRYEKSITLKSNGISSISLPITIFNHKLSTILKENERKNIDSVNYRFHGTFFTDIIFKKQINVDIKRFLPLIHIPEVKVEYMEIGSLNFSGAVVKLHLSIRNKNGYSLKARNIAYEVSIENNQWIKGTIPGLTDIQARSTTERTIPLKVSFKEIGKTLFDLLKKGTSVGYKLHLTFRIEPENNLMENSKVILESAGSVKSVIKAGKK